jgi:regulatory protein
MESEGVSWQACLVRAQNILALREHGIAEFRQKLMQKLDFRDAPAGLLDQLVQTCIEQNWLNEARYVESYCRMAMEKGQGPLKIRQALMTAVEDAGLVAEALALDDDVWLEVAQAALMKKYGECDAPKDRKEYARRLRFLQSRGFSGSLCYKAFSGSRAE